MAKDLVASFVVFLVALPLCMGVALASGVPPALGIVTGVVGGLLVGLVGGSHFAITGPAAGLIALSYAIVREHGLAGLGVAVLGAGLVQLAWGLFRIGGWFRAVSPAVVQGMLGGIGVLIITSQVHVMVDAPARSDTLANLAAIPDSFVKGLFPLEGTSHHLAALVGILTLVVLVGWERFRPRALAACPGALVAVLVATVASTGFALPVSRVEVPDSLASTLTFPTADAFALFADPGFVGATLALALVASVESLLCATAVDRLHEGAPTNYDRELLAQGAGNLVCGLLGALPLTGVIVRSSANIDAGAVSRRSALFQGAWLLATVLLLPFCLELIPTAALAAILVCIGYRLLDPSGIYRACKASFGEGAVLVLTLGSIVVLGLLWGVLLGAALALAKLLWTLAKVDVEVRHNGRHTDVFLTGAATFLRLPTLAGALDRLEHGREVHLHFCGLSHLDQACVELLRAWKNRYCAAGGAVEVDWASARVSGLPSVPQTGTAESTEALRTDRGVTPRSPGPRP